MTKAERTLLILVASIVLRYLLGRRVVAAHAKTLAEAIDAVVKESL